MVNKQNRNPREIYSDRIAQIEYFLREGKLSPNAAGGFRIIAEMECLINAEKHRVMDNVDAREQVKKELAKGYILVYSVLKDEPDCQRIIVGLQKVLENRGVTASTFSAYA